MELGMIMWTCSTGTCRSLRGVDVFSALSYLKRYCRSDLITMMGSLLCRCSDGVLNMALKQVSDCARKHMGDLHGSSFDHAVVWSFGNFVDRHPGWMKWKDDISNICVDYVAKWQGHEDWNSDWNSEAANVVVFANKIIEKVGRSEPSSWTVALWQYCESSRWGSLQALCKM